MCARTLWPLSSSTRNMAFGSDSKIVPSSTMASSLGLGRTDSSPVMGPAPGPGELLPGRLGTDERNERSADRPASDPIGPGLQPHGATPRVDATPSGLGLVHGGGQAAEDVVGVADAVDHDEAALALVELDERRRLRLVQVEPAVDRVGGVVVALHDVAAADLADPRL